MSDWIYITDVVDLPVGKWQEADVDNTSILVINMQNQFYAIENLCTHDGGTLADGCIEGEDIVCPRHGAKFCIKTGAVTAPPAYEDIKTFPLKVENGQIFVKAE